MFNFKTLGKTFFKPLNFVLITFVLGTHKTSCRIRRKIRWIYVNYLYFISHPVDKLISKNVRYKHFTSGYIFPVPIPKKFNIFIFFNPGGKIKKDVLRNFDINQDVYCFEFDIEELSKIEASSKAFVEPLKYPKIFRDFAFIFDKDISYKEVKTFISKKSSPLLKSIDLFDLFENESLGNNKKSMAFSLEYFDESRTLKEEEVEKDFVNLISLVTKNFNATLRGK